MSGVQSKADILQHAIEASQRRNGVGKLPDGITIHAIERTQTFGPKRSLEGELVVELEDGSLHRISGEEMANWSDALGPFVKQWRLPD
jgi:hypothetical protein